MATKLKKSASEKRLQSLKLSYCYLTVIGKPDVVVLEFGGDAAHWPSTSNSKSAFIPKGWNRAIITHAKGHKERLKVITECFAQHLFVTGQSIPEFGDVPVHVLIALADPKRASDSHNFSKPICDWLQTHQIVGNDRYSEAFCVRKGDYPTLFSDTKTTHVFVFRRELTTPLYLTAIGALLSELTV